MKQFLKTSVLIILIILTFISCSKNEANGEFHEVGDDEEWTEDWDAIAEENSDYKSNQNNFDAFQHFPSVENEPYEFAKNVFMVNEIREVGNNLVNQLARTLNSSSTLQNLLYDVDPNGLVVARLDQYYNEKSEKQILYIQRYKSIYDLTEERRLNETLNQEIEKRFNFKWYNGIKINYLLFYNVSLMTIKKNGKGKLIWQNIYTPFELTYLKYPPNIEYINIYDFTFESQMIDEILDKYVNWTYYNKKPK